jgi:FkbM family methyltransferase
MTKLKTDLYHLIEGRHGLFLANPQDVYIGRSMIAYGEFSEIEWRLLDQLVPPGGVVIEAGANMGTFTVPLARKVGASGLVYAFEPQVAVFQQLCANLALNDLLNVQALNAACGDESTLMGIARPDPAKERNFGGLKLTELVHASPFRVRVDKLDEVVDPPRLDLLKADVEGMETEVVRGATGLIDRFRPTLYLEAHAAADARRLIALLQGVDYKLWWHLPRMFNPDNHAENTDNLFGSITSNNMLCVPAEREVVAPGFRPVAGEDDHPTQWAR